MSHFRCAESTGLRRTSVPDALPVDLYLPGHDRGFESHEMVRIVRRYLHDTDDIKAVCRLLRRAERELQHHTGRTLMDCVDTTLAKHMNRSPHHRQRTALWKQLNDARVSEMRALALARQKEHPL